MEQVVRDQTVCVVELLNAMIVLSFFPSLFSIALQSFPSKSVLAISASRPYVQEGTKDKQKKCLFRVFRRDVQPVNQLQNQHRTRGPVFSVTLVPIQMHSTQNIILCGSTFSAHCASVFRCQKLSTSWQFCYWSDSFCFFVDNSIICLQFC